MSSLAEEAAAAVGLVPPRDATHNVPPAGRPAAPDAAPSAESPVAIVPGFLSRLDCARLIAYFEEHVGARAADMGRTGDKFFEGRVMWADSFPSACPAVGLLRSAQLRAEAVISHALGRPVFSDNVQVVRWPEGVAMPPHQDDRHPDPTKKHGTPWREYAGVLYLNADYDAGEIYFPQVRQAYKPEVGAFAFFPGPLWHGTKAPAGGPRYTSPQWFTTDPLHRDPGLPPPA